MHPAFSGSGFSASRCSLKANTQAARVSESRPIKRVLCTPPFLDRAFQLRCRSLKANTQAARVSESRPIKRVLCTPRGAVRPKLWICTDLYGFVRICTEEDVVKTVRFFSVPICTHPYPSVFRSGGAAHPFHPCPFLSVFVRGTHSCQLTTDQPTTFQARQALSTISI